MARGEGDHDGERSKPGMTMPTVTETMKATTSRRCSSITGGPGRRVAAVGLVAASLMVPIGAGAAPFDDRTATAVAREMMPDDVLTPTEGEILAQVHRALVPGGPGAADEVERASFRRNVELMTHQHARLLRRWLLSADQRVALGYERAALMDILITSHDASAHALGVEALLARPGLGYCMRALPPPARAGRLAVVVEKLAVVEDLRREAARLLLSVGEPAEAARTSAGAKGRAERIARAHPDVVRRWLLDETDAGIFDTYRAAVVGAFAGSADRSLRELAAEVGSRRPRLATTAAGIS